MKKLIFLLFFLINNGILNAQIKPDSIYSTPDIPASYIGGDSALFAYLKTNIKSDYLSAENIFRKTFIRLTIENTGVVSHAEILSKLNKTINDEILEKILRMPKWNPGKNIDKVVRSYIVFPIKVYFSDEAELGSTFYNASWNHTSEEFCTFYRIIKKNNNKFVVEYYDNKALRIEIGEFSTLSPPIKNGQFMIYYETGAIKSRCNFVNNNIQGEGIEYHKNGTPQEISNFELNLKHGISTEFMDDSTLVVTRTYDKGKLIKEKFPFREIQEKGKFDSDIYVDTNVILPHFPNGENSMTSFIDKNLIYPIEAKKNGIAGEVITQFVVEIDGTLSNIKVIKSIHPLLDKEAIRIIKLMPKWVPAKKRGKPIRLKYKWHAKFQ
ncbi:MAG: TonB family protein [Bacteroidota bacterium]